MTRWLTSTEAAAHLRMSRFEVTRRAGAHLPGEMMQRAVRAGGHGVEAVVRIGEDGLEESAQRVGGFGHGNQYRPRDPAAA